MKEKKLQRLRRLLHLVGLLQAGGERTVAGLAQRCKISRRTIFRDLDVLREANVPVKYDTENERYHIAGNYYSQPSNLTEEEARSLMILCRELGDHSRLPFFSPAYGAMVKLEGVLPMHLREQLRQVVNAVEIRPAPHNLMEGQETLFGQLLDAVGCHEAVRITYASLAEGEVISTRLSPYRLLFGFRSWYVIGRSSLHHSVRTFNVGRIRHLECLHDKFRIPTGFSLKRYLRNAWHLMPESGPDQEVHLRFSPKVAQNVAEICWHSTQQTQFAADGSLDFFVKVSGLYEISWWILGYGAEVEVISPIKLRHTIAQHAAKLVQLYQAGDSPATGDA